MRRYAQTAVLLLLGGVLLRLAFGGTYARYVTGTWPPLLIVAGLALVAVGGATLWRDISFLRNPSDDGESTGPMRLGGLFGTVILSGSDRGAVARPEPPPPAPAGAAWLGEDPTWPVSIVDNRERALAAGLAAAAHEGLDEDGAGEPPALAAPTALLETVGTDSPAVVPEQAGGALRAQTPVDPFELVPGTRAPAAMGGQGSRGGWALLALALVILVLAPAGLGDAAAARTGAATPGPVAPLPDGDPVPLSLADYAALASAGGQALGERQVRLVGFLLAGPRAEPYLVRFTAGCCAAGARPIKVGLVGELPGELVPGQWLSIVGTYSELVDRDLLNGAPVPFVSVVEVTLIEEPADLYE